VRGRNECNEAAAPWCVWGGDVDANHRPLLNGNCGNAGELSDEIAEVRLMSDEKEGVVTTSGEEFGDMRRGWAVGKLIVNGGGGL
jgi:hypothetical protein